jgi:predicted O-linked N-acetylglucosamine transferase (SPINDLY family)
MNSSVQTQLEQAVKAFHGQDFIGAEKALRNIMAQTPHHYDASHLLAIVCANQGRHEEAIGYYRKALQLSPESISVLSNLGASLNSIGQNDEALFALEAALKINPNLAALWFNAGNITSDLGDFKKALNFYEECIKLNPEYLQAHNNFGKALFNIGDYLSALICYDQALELNPDYAEAWSNKGNALGELKRFDEALACYDKALSIKGDYAEIWSNKGSVLSMLKRYDESIICYKVALDLNADINWIYGDQIYAKMKVCHWADFQENAELLERKVRSCEKVINPFQIMALSDDSLLHRQCAQIYVQDRYPANPTLGPILKRPRKEKICIAYYSADFCNHPTAHLTAELYELHDKTQFEVIAFSFGPDDQSSVRSRLCKAFSQFIDVSDFSDEDIAKLSRRLGVDIAIDMGGFAAENRTGIFACRAAPIQVNYLVYPGTMAAQYMDYIVADKILIPPSSQHFYSEKVVYLPNSYQVNDSRRTFSGEQPTRQSLGLPEKSFVFCCFNNNHKIVPTCFDLWMRILKAVDGSVLWLLEDNAAAAENLKKEAMKRGVDGDRLVFAKRAAALEHMMRHRAADLFLDTLPYNAHTTASDALWMGLPVLTLMGESFAGRVAASLLNAVGLPELITHTAEEYAALAIALATDFESLRGLRARLEKNRLTQPLFDTPLFTRNLESAYIKMYEVYQLDLSPEHILI